MQNVVKLQESELVTYAKEGSDGGELGSTEYGDIMSKACRFLHISPLSLLTASQLKFYIRQSTVC